MSDQEPMKLNRSSLAACGTENNSLVGSSSGGTSNTPDEAGLAESTAGDARGIQAIDKSSVHRICSGQVVLNLATAIKELVENSLDAGATNIDVRLRDHGSELLEVVDNGAGVEEDNFAGLTLKHHTSKLKDFSDLVSVDTFGFRGEALSSLCALSKLTVTTCHESSSVGTKIEYNHNGKILKQTRCARQKGTTVTLENLFSTLPVRHKEFLRNIKREFSKAVTVLNAYCLISTGVRITCTNQVGKGKKNIVVSTGGNSNVKENVTNIFGAKQVQSLLPFVQSSPTEEVCAEYSLKGGHDAQVFQISGFVSSSEHGQGRSSADRQYYFINRRPCDPQKISRLVSEVYHMYNRHQNPFVMLDISLAKDSVDVNVTPDKRQIFVQEERRLLAVIKTSLMKMFEPKSSTYRVNQIPSTSKAGGLSNSFSKSPRVSSPDKLNKTTLTSTLANLKRSFSSAFAKEPQEEDTEPVKQRKLDNFFNFNAKTETTEADISVESLELPESPISAAEVNMTDDLTSSENPSDSAVECVKDSAIDSANGSQSSGVGSASTEMLDGTDNEILAADTNSADVKTVNEEKMNSGTERVLNESYSLMHSSSGTPTHSVKCEDKKSVLEDEKSSDIIMIHDNLLLTENSQLLHKRDVSTSEVAVKNTSKITVTEFDAEKPQRRVKEMEVPFSMSALSERLKNQSKNKKDRKLCRSFRAQINPSDNGAAEEELQKEISKDMFKQMKILGQFNLGFIIALLGRDLFIIDQHATDEKFNFETLQRETVIQGQRLIQPQNLELTAANECILIDNVDVFRRNGFEFIVDEQAPPTQRVRLVTMPVSKNWTFGKDDIEELVFMLTDSPGVMCRPSRVRQMFASRACRKSIMIGTALNKTEMRKLVLHMGELDQPWNCPHGRPTMRHLINLDMLPD